MATLKLKSKATLGESVAAAIQANVDASDTRPIIMAGATLDGVRRMVFSKACTVTDGVVTGGRNPYGATRERYARTFDSIAALAARKRTIDTIRTSQTERGVATALDPTNMAVLYASKLIGIDWTTGAIVPRRGGFPMSAPSGFVPGCGVTDDDIAWARGNADAAKFLK